MFQPFAADLARRVASVKSGHLLEIACGTGIATLALAGALPADIKIVASDLNQPMINFAQQKSGMERVTWRQADAMALPFADAEFDAVVCQFGVMFFPDHVAGFKEMHRVLKPGGRLIFSVWDEISTNPVMQAVMSGLTARYPQQPSWFIARTPCGYRDPKVIRAHLAEAGFADCIITTVTLPTQVAAAEDPAIGLCQGSPMRGEIEALDPEGLDAATQAVVATIVSQFGSDTFDTKLQALVVETGK